MLTTEAPGSQLQSCVLGLGLRQPRVPGTLSSSWYIMRRGAGRGGRAAPQTLTCEPINFVKGGAIEGTSTMVRMTLMGNSEEVVSQVQSPVARFTLRQPMPDAREKMEEHGSTLRCRHLHRRPAGTCP